MLLMVCPENSENQNSEIAANTSEVLNEIASLNLNLMNNVTIKFIKVSSFLEILQNSQENSYVRVLKKETLAQVFSCEFCESSKNDDALINFMVTLLIRCKFK